VRRLLTAAAAAAAIGGALAGCATPTPYGPAVSDSRYSFGYRDQRLDADHWRVSFSGNSVTARETVEKYLLYRAAELTVQNGFDWFEATDRQTERHTRYYGYSDPWDYGWGWSPHWRYWGRGGWGPWGGFGGWGGWGSSYMDVQEVSRYEAAAEIVMGRGPAPGDRKVFNAREVMANLGPTLVMPEPKP